jgi:hypothetical protein
MSSLAKFMRLYIGNNPELSRAIALIDALDGFGGIVFNPQRAIEAVNYLYTLGYEKSIQVLRLYCELIDRIENEHIYGSFFKSDRRNIVKKITTTLYNIFLVARLLFIRKGRQLILPEIHIGQPEPVLREMPESLQIFPMFPIHLYRDIPLVIVTGYMCFGFPQHPLTYIEWCAGECEMRSAPLMPHNNPLACVDEFLESGCLTKLSFNLVNPQYYCKMLRSQALRAVSAAYPLDKRKDGESLLLSFTEEEANEKWSRHRQAFAELNISWNPATNQYERG